MAFVRPSFNLLALALLLAPGQTKGDTDIDDIDCTSPENFHITKVYCSAVWVADKLVYDVATPKFLSIIGWSLILFYHLTLVAEAYQAYHAGTTPDLSRARSKTMKILKILTDSSINETAKFCRQLGQNILVYWCYFGAKGSWWEAATWMGMGAFLSTGATALLLWKLLSSYASGTTSSRPCACTTIVLPIAVVFGWGGWNLGWNLGKEASAALEENPVIHSLLLVVFDLYVLWFARCLIIRKLVQGKPIIDIFRGSDAENVASEEGHWFAPAASLEKYRKADLSISSIYVLPGKSVGLVWLSQTVLTFFYFAVANQNSKEIRKEIMDEKSDNHHALTWMIGVLLICTVGEGQAGNEFDYAGWFRMIIHSSKVDPGALTSPSFLSFDFWLRCFCDWSVNSIYRQLLLSTFAVFICKEGPIDFIKDILAILFIVVLDDPTEEYKDEIKKEVLTYVQKEKEEEVTPQDLADAMWYLFKGRFEVKGGILHLCMDLYQTCFSQSEARERPAEECEDYEPLA